ncbi:MAG TPA: divalent metal cation transporter [Rubrobacter sp.]
MRILEGNTPAILFGVALLASGLSSSSVGTLSGQVAMQGFISRQIPLFLRRLITMMLIRLSSVHDPGLMARCA